MAMFGFSSCNKDCGHDFIEVDYSNDIVGTWTCLEPDHSAAYIFNADGTLSTTGFDGDAHWEDEKGTYSIVNNKITMKFESGRIINGSFDIIPGKTISIVGEKGRHTYEYCKEDFSDEVVGMWVCVDGPSDKEADMVIQVFDENGTVTKTGWSVASNKFIVKEALTYKVVGDLLFHQRPSDMVTEGVAANFASKLTYMPNANQLGDMLTNTTNKVVNGKVVELSMSMLRIKQSLELPGMKYDYIKTFVSNVKGLDKDVDVMGYTFNFAKMDGVVLDKMLKTVLFAVEFPDANTIRYSCKYNEFSMEMDAPIVVDGNKMTVKMSQRDAAYRDVDLYTFQDQDNTQMHMYMHTTAFVNFFGNMQIAFMSELGQLDKTDANAVKAVFDGIDAAVESINLSLVMTKARK